MVRGLQAAGFEFIGQMKPLGAVPGFGRRAGREDFDED